MENEPMLSWCLMLLFLTVVLGLWRFWVFNSANIVNRPLPPGPVGLPIIGHLHILGDLPHRTLHKLSQRYGPIMQLRLGLIPTIVVSSPEAAEMFHKTHDLNFSSRPKIQASEYLSYGSRGAVFAEYGAYWRNVRKLYALHLLSNTQIESFKHLRMEEVMNLVQILKCAAEKGEVVNLSDQVGLVIEKISYGMIFGSKYKERFNFKPCVQEAISLISAKNFADILPFMRSFDLQGLTRRMKEARKIMDDFLEKIIDEHQQNNTGHNEKHRDFIDVMVSLVNTSNAHQETLDKTDIKAITLDMVATATGGAITTLEWALIELLRYPRTLKLVQEELVNVIGVDCLVHEADLEKLSYLNMVVKETMRLHPPGTLNPRKSIDDITISGFHIPKKTLVIINIWAIGRDVNAWGTNADVFYPERFNNTEIDIRGHHMQLIPFGSGRRKCPGMELGIRTVKFVLAQLLHCFNFEFAHGMLPNDGEIKENFGVTVKISSPLLVIPTFRLSNVEGFASLTTPTREAAQAKLLRIGNHKK